ncbi:MAG: hypothetical protein R3Y09_06205 [Clostridia bacterium]
MSKQRPIKTVEEMAAEISQDKVRNPRLNYKEQSDEHKSKEISISISNKIEILEDITSRGKTDLNNIEEVKIRAIDYFKACELASSFPSVMGLASHGFGISRQALDKYLQNNNNETTEYIKMVKDQMADILTNESLYNRANAVQALFQLKNHFGHADKIELQAVTQERDTPSITQLEEKYQEFSYEDTE